MDSNHVTLSLQDAAGRTLAEPITHPETRHVVYTGTVLTDEVLAMLRDWGADYVVVRDEPTPVTLPQFLDSLDYYPTRELLAALRDALVHSNGAEFCDRDMLLEVATLLRIEAVRRGNDPA